MRSHEFPPVEAIALIRVNIHRLVTETLNRFRVLRQSPTTAVLPEVRMPIHYIVKHNIITMSYTRVDTHPRADLTTFMDLYLNFE